MAKTLQRNAVDARAAVDPETYYGFLKDLRNCFAEPDSKDTREVVVLMLVMCEWPKEEPPQLRGMMEDLVKIVLDWVTCKPIRFWTFRPWLAAMLANRSEALASVYVSELFKTGLLHPCTDCKFTLSMWQASTNGSSSCDSVISGEREFAVRVATLSSQGEVVETVLQPSLGNLDSHLQETYFGVKSNGL
ncbi:unnamed protein product [Phytophthora fragariaefolia]|uniref:Unnamed protein product n=1 Tax=Phytophthora fragariaefolia TaxID=1490495 RepID=A0A9W7CHP3_9STRA|nr:unnamed protein product [Phytophthora fragariaefolia]